MDKRHQFAISQLAPMLILGTLLKFPDKSVSVTIDYEPYIN